MAARNVFLTCDMKAKVAYVGVSTRRCIQAKWSAFEVLQSGSAIKELSDVWSFGVFMWEIFHLGSEIPYEGKNGTKEILQFLEKGHRLSKPELCPQYIYDLMLECWQEWHLLRPTFLQLKNKLINMEMEHV